MNSRFVLLCRALLLGCLIVTPAVAEEKSAATGQSIKINIQNGDIRDLIKWIAKSTGKNIIIDPRVKGKVTILSNDGVAPDEAYKVMLSALQVHGFSAVESEGVIKVIPDTIARHSALPVVDADGNIPDDLAISILKPRHIGVTQLMTILRPLVPQTGHLAAYPASNALIVADRQANIEKLRRIISRIDNASEQKVEVVELKFASADEVVQIIKAMMPAVSGKQDSVNSYQIAVDDRTNSILLSGEVTTRKKLRKIIDALDTPEQTEGNTRVVYLHYLKAQEVSSILKGMVDNLKKDSADSKVSKAQVSIQPSETTNALVITAPSKLMEPMLAVIKKLDIRRAQVLVEAIIVEVKDDLASELGVQWSSRDSADTSSGLSAGVRNSLGGGSSFSDFQNGTVGPGLSLGFFQNGSLKALINAMSSSDAFNLLSTPNLVTLDNEEAKIIVGQNVPFVTGRSTSSSSSTDNPFQTIERQDVGTKLTITPQINGGDSITLKVDQEISSINNKTEASDVVTDTRSITTKVLVQDGSILVLGGLITDQVTSNESKVPLLGDLPLLGRLFRSDRIETTKRNLMLFIKPTIIKDARFASQVSHGRYRFVQDAQRQFGEKLKKETRWNDALPIIPDIDNLSAETPITFSYKQPAEEPEKDQASN